MIVFHEHLMGQMKNDKCNGQGVKYFANGDTYTGDWVNDQKAGQGVFTSVDGERYERRYSQRSY
jgi:hypothetical protein